MSTSYVRLRDRFAVPDLDVCQALNRCGQRSTTRGIFRTISRLGDGPAWYALMTLLACFGGQTGAFAALHLALVGLSSLVLYRGLKRWTRRPRPFAQHQSIQAHLAPLDEFSFPSGHTLHATAFSIVTCYYFPTLIWVLLPFTLLVALSRVILGLHYPSDVLAAFAIGGVLAGASIRLL